MQRLLFLIAIVIGLASITHSTRFAGATSAPISFKENKMSQTKDGKGIQRAGITGEVAALKTHAKATFALNGWDEKPYNEMNGLPKLTRVSVTKSYQGGITGEGKLDYLMMYRDDGSASFLGLERVVGSVGGRAGSFVLQHNGTFKGGVATVTLLVVPGSGTGDLRGLRGHGEFAVGHQQPYTMTLDYDIE
jgi:Protein of unknown function (DUF3224)